MACNKCRVSRGEAQTEREERPADAKAASKVVKLRRVTMDAKATSIRGKASSTVSSNDDNSSDEDSISNSSSNSSSDSSSDEEDPDRRRAETFEANHARRWAKMALKSKIDDQRHQPAAVVALATEQLRLLNRANKKGSKEEALAQNKKNVQKAKKNSTARTPSGNFKLPSLVVDGKGDHGLRQAVAEGRYPPAPFATHGMVGWVQSATASWFREWCAVGCPRRQEGAMPKSRRAWHGGRMSSNKKAATEAFRKRKHGNDAETAFEGLKRIFAPEAQPQWVSNLKSDLDSADSFWE